MNVNSWLRAADWLAKLAAAVAKNIAYPEERGVYYGMGRTWFGG